MKSIPTAICALAIFAASAIAAPQRGATVIETTPNGYTLTVSVGGSGKTGRLSLACPSGTSLGRSARFAIHKNGAFVAARRRAFTFTGRFDRPNHVRGSGSVSSGRCPAAGTSFSEGRIGGARMLSCPPSSPEAPLAAGTVYSFAGIVPNAGRGTELRLEYTDPNSPTGRPAVVHLRTDSRGAFTDHHAFPINGGSVYGASATPRYPDDPLASGTPCGMTVQG